MIWLGHGMLPRRHKVARDFIMQGQLPPKHQSFNVPLEIEATHDDVKLDAVELRCRWLNDCVGRWRSEGYLSGSRDVAQVQDSEEPSTC